MNGEQSTHGEGDSLAAFLQEEAVGLAKSARQGVLGTLDGDGYPHTSLVEVAFDDEGHFWLLLSKLAVHTRNIKRDVRASLLLAEEGEEKGEVLARTRGTYVGRIIEMDHLRDEIAPLYLEKNPHARDFMKFADFRFFRLRVERVRVVAGFGRIGWVEF